MINKPRDWDNVQAFGERRKLPLGAYVVKVIKVAVEQTRSGDQQLCILFDICEGEYSGFYRSEFNASTSADKRWKGVLRQWIPRDDGGEKDEITKRVFKGLITSFEKSNPGYIWNWDEATLAGKLVGVVYRNEEWEYDGKSGWAVRPFRALSIDSVRSGEFTLPQEKPLNRSASSYTAPANNGFAPIAESEDDDLPF